MCLPRFTVTGTTHDSGTITRNMCAHTGWREYTYVNLSIFLYTQPLVLFYLVTIYRFSLLA